MLPMPTAAMIEKYGRPGPRYTSYPAATEWTAAFDDTAAEERLARADAVDAPLSIYVHVPFCAEMCRFCGCNVIATRDRSRADTYLDVLEREVELWAARLPHRRRVSQLHLGGGTPTFLSEPQLERLSAILSRHFTFTSDGERAIEIDPAVTTPGQLALLGRLGFNRVSIGVQDLDPKVQAAVNRVQGAAETQATIDAARTHGMTNVNVDLMYGLPHQTPATFEATVERVLAMGPDRFALFGYAHVPWVKPHQNLLPQAFLPGPVQRVELFVQAARRLESAGYRQLGLDHFAREDDTLVRGRTDGTITRNFQGYSTHAAPDTIAFGVSAISDVAGAFVQNAHKLANWERAVHQERLPVERGLVRTADDELRGDAIRTLMCTLQVGLDPLVKTHGDAAVAMFDGARPTLDALAEDGLVAVRDDGVEVLPMGQIFLRNVAMAFDGRLATSAGRFSTTV